VALHEDGFDVAVLDRNGLGAEETRRGAVTRWR
jgi:hypothetical protein